jgi:hypothetical protein
MQCSAQKKVKLISDGGDSGIEKCKEDCVGTYGTIWWSLESGLHFCVGAFDRSLAFVTLKMFSCLIYVLKNVVHFLPQCDTSMHR